MSYFLPSHVQKRLLRYALSYPQLIDTENLDLDQLDIAWGMRSSVELRDVGVEVHVSIGVLVSLCSNLHRTWPSFATCRPIWSLQPAGSVRSDSPFPQTCSEAESK
jgi:hypothetical protein